MMKKRVMQVTLHARQASVVELTVGDRVQLDRLVPSTHGHIAERHGDLLGPGRTSVVLDQGHYLLRTLSDANLHVIRGGVDAVILAGDKTGGPIELAQGGTDAPAPGLKGDLACGELPSFTID